MIRRKRVVTGLAPAEIIGSLCVCGHVGDSKAPVSTHDGVNGHGRCRIKGCKCEQFTWKAFLEVER